jgi:hypothetical protein
LQPLLRSVPPTSSTTATSAPLRSIELHTSINLRVDELLFSSQQQVHVALEIACCKAVSRVLDVSDVCYKCFIWMLQK